VDDRGLKNMYSFGRGVCNLSLCQRNVVAKRLVLLFRSQGGHGSSLGPASAYPARFFVIFVVLPGKYRDGTL
jgi:hypothetical protein